MAQGNAQWREVPLSALDFPAITGRVALAGGGFREEGAGRGNEESGLGMRGLLFGNWEARGTSVCTYDSHIREAKGW